MACPLHLLLAVHLRASDLVQDMSAPAFLRSLQCFIAWRGTPSLVISDNANQVEWQFNLEKAPERDGIFRPIIQSAKSTVLRRQLARITFF